MPKLTKTLVERGEPEARDIYLWDTHLPGFGVKITPAGRRVYFVQYRPKGQLAVTRRYTIGRHGSPWTTETARDAASTLLARARLGEDPFKTDRDRRAQEAADAQADKERRARDERERFSLLVDEFIETHAKRNRRWDEAARILSSKDVSEWHDRPVSEITKRDVIHVVERATRRASGAGRLLFAHLRKFFGWCAEKLYIEQSPFVGLKSPAPPRARDRTLSDDELALIWKAVASLSEPYAALFKVLLLTGQRREEVTAMLWGEVDLRRREWIIPSNRAKNGQSHAIDLCDLVVEVLQERLPGSSVSLEDGPVPGLPPVPLPSRPVFASSKGTPVSYHSQAKAELDAAIALVRRKADPSLREDEAALKPWRIHDLRRTAATGMARLGHPPHVVEAVLNHRSGVRGGLVAVYQHYDHRTERQRALSDWGRHVANIARQVDLEDRGEPQSLCR